MSFTGILVWMMSTIGARILASLGMGFLTFAAVTTAADIMLGEFSAMWGTLPADVFNIISLAGFPEALGWIIGAYLSRLALNALPKLSKLPV